MSSRSKLPGPRVWVLLLFVVLVGIELGLSHFGGYGAPPPKLPDERLGWRKPGNLHNISPEGILFRTNSLGYRDREWAPPAEAELPVTSGGRDGLRIAVLGDSMHYGPCNAEEDLWMRKLELSLQAAEPERECLVMNFAVTGYVFEQMSRVWEDQIRAWRPDIVIIGVNAWMARPMRILESRQVSPVRGWIEQTATFDLLKHAAIFESKPWEFRWESPPQGDGRTSRAIEKSMRGNPFAAENARLWQAMLGKLRIMRAELDEYGGELVFLSIPRVDHLEPGGRKWSGDHWDSMAKAVDATHVDLLPAFEVEMRDLLVEIDERGGGDEFWGVHAPRDGSRELSLAEKNLYLFSDREHMAPRGQDVVEEHVREALLELLRLAH